MAESGMISIIVPVYKVEKYLDRCVQSIVDQSYRNLEIILVDDGSPDHCGAMCDAWAEKDSRIKVIHKRNEGVTLARIQGVDYAAGEWIGFVDGDDYIEPWMYERLLLNAREYGADISHCGYRMVLPSGRIREYYNTEKKIIQDKHSGVKDLLEGKFVEPGVVNKIFRRKLFQDLRTLVNEAIKNNEDLLMNFYLFRRAERSVFEDVCPYHYILRPGSAANAKLNIHQLEDPLKVKRILFWETEGNEELHRIAGSQLVRHLVYLSTLATGDNAKLIIPVRKQARKELRSMLGQVLRGNYCSKKFKIIALWTAVWPWSYGFVHRTYEKITGLDKIYEK